MERGSQKDVGRARWAGRGKRMGGVWGDPTPCLTGLLWALVGKVGRAWLWLVDPLGVGHRRWAPACVRLCTPVRPGPAGRRPHVDASLVHSSRPVGKAGCGAAGRQQTGL